MPFIHPYARVAHTNTAEMASTTIGHQIVIQLLAKTNPNLLFSPVNGNTNKTVADAIFEQSSGNVKQESVALSVIWILSQQSLDGKHVHPKCLEGILL